MQPLGKTTGITPTALLAIIWLTVGIAILFTILRTAIRLHVFRRLHADDFWVYLALAVLTTIATLYNYAVPIMFEFEYIIRGKKQIGPDFVDRARLFLRLQFAIIVLFWTCIWAVKFSFLVWYRKMMNVPSNREMSWNVVTIFTVLSYLGCWATQLEACHPISNYFVLGECESKRDIYVSNLSLYYSTVVDILCDLLIMALPLKVLLKLQINRRQKFGLGILFGLVFIIIAFTIVRVIRSSASAEHVNPIWLALWSIIEASVAVMVSCLPSFHVLLNSHFSSSYRRRHRAPNFQQQDHDPGGPSAPAAYERKATRNIDQEIAEIIMGHEIEIDPDHPPPLSTTTTNTQLQKAGTDDDEVLFGDGLPGIPPGNLYGRYQEEKSERGSSEVGILRKEGKLMVLDV